jgi:DNA-binding XRE family transcriptional regulator
MIRNENEYKEAVVRLIAEEKRIAAQAKELEGMELTAEQIKRVIDPLQSFHLQLAEEVESYERLKRREIQEIRNLRGLGHALICIRIASGLNQRELAEKLGVNESQISRDERNEYHGITLERAAKILEALGVEICIGVNIKEPLPA